MPELTASQRALVETWEQHMAAEFDTQSIDATMATMTTGRYVEVALVVVVEFVEGRISGERIYWDQASVLAQVGMLDVAQLPATGGEAARKVRDPGQEPSNVLIARWTGSRT